MMMQGGTVMAMTVWCVMTDWLLLAAACWLAANLLFAGMIEGRRRRWERGVRRGADGVLSDATPFSVGGGGVAVLLVHGFADTPAVFRRLADALSAHGLLCRAMRLPGAGAPLAVAARQTTDTWLAALRAEVAALREDHREVWLLGHSMGGSLALLAQLDAPGTADGLILLAPLIEVSAARAPFLPPRCWFRVTRAILPLARVMESAFPLNVLTRGGARIGYTRDRYIPLATYRGLFALVDRLRGRGSELHAPFFAVLVEGDRIVDAPAARAWLAACPATRRRIETLDGCGHALPQETALLDGLADGLAGFIAGDRPDKHAS